MDWNEMALVVDGITLLIFVFAVVRGWSRGFLSVLLRVLSFVLALFIAYELYGWAAKLLIEAGLRDTVAAKLSEKFASASGAAAGGTLGFIESLPLPDFLKVGLVGNNNAEAFAALGVSGFAAYVGMFLANVLVNGIAIVGVFLISLILLRLIAKQLRAVNRVPLVGLMNRILGIVLQVGLTLMVLWFVLFVMTSLSAGGNVFAKILSAIEQSVIGGWIYRNNFINDWLLHIA